MTDYYRTLPFAPLLAQLDRSTTVREQCSTLDLNERAYFRYRRSDRIPLLKADELACRLNLHPVLLWPTEWLEVLEAEAW